MAPRLLQIRFKLRGVTPAEYEQASTQAAQRIAAVPGLRWKVWPLSDDDEAGGMYLFDDEASLRAYVDGPIVEHLKHAPFVEELSIREYGVIESLTAITRGPAVTAEATA